MAPDVSGATCNIVKQSSEGKRWSSGSPSSALGQSRAGEKTDLLNHRETRGTHEQSLKKSPACGMWPSSRKKVGGDGT